MLNFNAVLHTMDCITITDTDTLRYLVYSAYAVAKDFWTRSVSPAIPSIHLTCLVYFCC